MAIIVLAMLCLALFAPAKVAHADDVLQAAEIVSDGADASEPADAADGEQAQGDMWVQAEDGWRFTRDGETVVGAWVDTATAPAIEGAPTGEQRYWLDAQGLLACARLVDPATETDAGAGYYAYATEFGAVAQGKTVVGDKVYLAKTGGKKPGKLESGNSKGFLKTSDYDKAERRYYIDPVEHAAITGKVIEVADWGKLYAYPGKGFLAVGVKKFDDTHLLVADSIGRLCQETGWVTAKKYAGTSQRYYFERTTADKNVIGARTGLFKVKGFGYAYAYPNKGYVVRGVKKFDAAHALVADADGKLLQKAGWATTSKYAGASQRYYLEPTKK
ncbi:MAG: hypothetical protein IJ087_14840, partial [Eggerthellaceae bacterium]|nr:hypothetical protein [Eggerthellaceae bacterium]